MSRLLLLLLLGLASDVKQASSSWIVTYPEHVKGVRDSCILIPCTFSYPSDVTPTQGITAIWYKDYSAQRTVVYHSDTPDTADARFRDRVQLVGDALARNCTLLLRTVTSEDSGLYTFRFEISEGNRWSDQRGVSLAVTDAPEMPIIASPEDLLEGVTAHFICSSPYVCPESTISLQWTGYNSETSRISGTVQLDTVEVLMKQTLNVSLSWQDHNRHLGCKVSVEAQTAVGQVTLSVKHSPKGVTVSLSPSSKNIRVGEAATLTCTVESSYPAVTAYRWYKDGTACGNEQVKTIQSVAREDYGLYRCEAENSVGTGAAAGVTLYVFSAVLSVSPSPRVREGETVTLTCEIPGEDKQEIHYSWYKNNIWIKEGTARILVFHEVIVGDTGYYSCKVQNDKGSETSEAVGLAVVYPPREPILTWFQETLEGKLAIVYCTTDSNPQAHVSLYRDKQLIATTSSHSAPSQRTSITSTRNALKMEIQEVVPGDEGVYRCVATNAYGNATTARFFGAQTARVVVRPSGEVLEGVRVTLTCMATLTPGEGTTYAWYKNAKWIQEGREDSLVFSTVASTDAGTFHCVARKKELNNTSPAVVLRVLYSPLPPLMSSFLETQGGHLGIIQCQVDSDPASHIVLRKDGTLIGSSRVRHSPTDPRVSVTPSHNTLKVTIQEVTLEDEGLYVCSARNPYGNSSSSMDFAAETARIIIAPSPEVQEGDAVRLSCVVSANASTSANYTWYRNGIQLSKAREDSLEVQHVTRADAGVYSCRAEHLQASKSSSPTSLAVLYPPETPQLSVFVETERGRVAIFRCAVDSNPVSKLVLSKGSEVIASSEARGAAPRVSISTAHNAMRVEMRDVVPEDAGSYNITACNAYGSSSRSVYFYVQTARVLVTPSPELVEGDALTLTCDVMGSAPDDSTFSWYKNSKRLPGTNTRVLAFPRTTNGDTGSYHCKAHAPDETSMSASPSVVITVFYPPRKPQLTSFLQTQDRQVAVIHCTVESDPQSQLALYRRGELLAATVSASPAHSQRVGTSATYNSLRVEIRDVVMEDEGGYVCSASNPYGNASSSIEFTAETARIWISPSDVLEGQSVNFTCAVETDAGSQVRYTWYKNSRWHAEGLSETLALPSATAADSGSYYCTVTTRDKIRNSTLATLNVLYPPRNAWVKSFLETQNGKLAIIVCAVDSNPLSELLLRRGSEVLAANSFQVRRGPDHRLSAASAPNSLRLEIKGLRLDDEGLYECVARNPTGNTSISLDFTVQTTRVVIKPSPDVREGDPASVTCEDAALLSASIYTWYKNSKWLSEGSDPSLAFPAVTASEMGSYSCQIRNERGIRKSPPAVLHVLYAPKKPSLTSFLETQSGNQAILQCTVDSHPPSDIALYKGDQMVASSWRSEAAASPRLHVHSAPNALKVEIKGVLLEDEGQYLCSANNTYGTSAAAVHFSVESARITIDPSPNIRERAAANLTCVIDSRAGGEMNYTWYKNSKWLQEGLENSLLLSGVTREDTGSYHCQATGRTGSVTSALAALNVLYAPQSPSVDAFLDNQNGGVGILHCKVDSHPRSQLAFFKGDRLVAATKLCCSTSGRRITAFPSYNGLKLEIRELTPEDSGRYTCLARNPFGNASGTVDFRAETLSDLHLFKILAGLFIAVTCIAILCGLAFGVRKNWARINQECKVWKRTKTKEADPVRNKEETTQLNEQNPETPLSGRLCLSYKRLRAKIETPPQETAPDQSCTSAL